MPSRHFRKHPAGTASCAWPSPANRCISNSMRGKATSWPPSPTPAPEEVAHEPPLQNAGPCVTAQCERQAQKYGAANGGRPPVNWKYALSLELADTGFDFSVLSEFRARLAEADAGRAVFNAVLAAAGEASLVTAGKRQRTDATHVLAATRDLSRLEFVVKTLRAALNQIAEAAGDWLVTVGAPEWFDRYSARPEDSRFPSRWAARVEHGDQCGGDGTVLLQAVWSASAPPRLRSLPRWSSSARPGFSSSTRSRASCAGGNQSTPRPA